MASPLRSEMASASGSDFASSSRSDSSPSVARHGVPTIVTKAKTFCPPSPDDTPVKLFHHLTDDANPVAVDVTSNLDEHVRIARTRMVSRTSPNEEILIYTAGRCVSRSQNLSVIYGGCAFVYKPVQPAPLSDRTRGHSFRLELKGPPPTFTVHDPTDDRAELRAVVGVLKYNTWLEEPWKRIVIATTSPYVVSGMTSGINQPLNQDLWRTCFKTINNFANRGLDVLFWLIPDCADNVAVWMAHDAASLKDNVEDYEMVYKDDEPNREAVPACSKVTMNSIPGATPNATSNATPAPPNATTPSAADTTTTAISAAPPASTWQKIKMKVGISKSKDKKEKKRAKKYAEAVHYREIREGYLPDERDLGHLERPGSLGGQRDHGIQEGETNQEIQENQGDSIGRAV